MSKKPLPPDQVKKLFNCKLSSSTIHRIKKFAWRESVHAGKKVSEAVVIAAQMDKAPLPKKPTAAAEAAYIAASGREPPEPPS